MHLLLFFPDVGLLANVLGLLFFSQDSVPCLVLLVPIVFLFLLHWPTNKEDNRQDQNREVEKEQADKGEK